MVRAAIEPLEVAGNLSRKGSFVEITPPILANRLAARLVQGRPADAMVGGPPARSRRSAAQTTAR